VAPIAIPQTKASMLFVLFFLVLASPGGDAGTEAASLAAESAQGKADRPAAPS
jgi:hypothetical protein